MKYLLIALLVCNVINSQPINKPAPNPTPLDGGLIILAVAGTAYGIKQYKKKYHLRNQNTGKL